MHDATSFAALERAREIKLMNVALDHVSLDGTFEGYASLFHRRDMSGDMVMPGAFRASLAARGPAGIRMLFQHDPAQPIGVWDKLYEDARGLYARGRLTTEVSRAREVLALMRSGAIDGLSIGFRTVKSRREGRNARALLEIDLWEISIVTFPMLPEARIGKVKALSFGGATPTTREFERWLTQDAGFTRSEARALMRDGIKGLEVLRDGTSAHGWQKRLVAQMAAAAELLRSAPRIRNHNHQRGSRC